MLVLTIARHEQIVLRDDAGRWLGNVVFCEQHGNKVRIGFDGLDEIEVNREEVDRKKFPHQEAT